MNGRRAAADVMLAQRRTPQPMPQPIKEARAMTEKPYEDIPGTFVFDADRGRVGYHLNQFCISLRLAANREAFAADPSGYLDRYPMSAEQRKAVEARDWNEMLRLGGNIYYTSKLAANDGINFQDLAAMMTGVSREEYRDMMLHGGRPIEGNRYKSEWGED
jgi:protocatechuate 4,5-dioxygenase alpha chain